MSIQNAPTPSRPRTIPGHAPGRAGFTLLELITALVIGTVTLGGLVSLTGTSAITAHGLRENLGSLHAGIDALAAVRHDLQRARIVSVAADGTSLEYSLPIPTGPGGAYVDDAGDVTWGINDADGLHPDGTATLSFEFETKILESERGEDLNGDGDRDDSFDVGRLARTTSTGQKLAMPRIDLIVPSGDRGGDLDGDGKPDPLFSVEAAHRQVLLQVARIARNGRLRRLPVRIGVADLGPGATP